MNDILKLQYMSLCSKIMQELEIHVGIKDRTLAEFIIGKNLIKELGKDSQSEKEF